MSLTLKTLSCLSKTGQNRPPDNHFAPSGIALNKFVYFFKFFFFWFGEFWNVVSWIDNITPNNNNIITNPTDVVFVSKKDSKRMDEFIYTFCFAFNGMDEFIYSFFF